MTWRSKLARVTLTDGRRMIGASFRGVPFLVSDSSRSGGRRTEVHEFPQRDEPWIDDLGRRARAFRIEGYVIGADYLAQRDALLDALEERAGPGELVHPYHGVRRAICGRCDVRETVREGGMATFSLMFHEAPSEPTAPTDEPDLPEQVEADADAAREAVEEELVENYDVDGQPAFALESLAAEFEALSDALDDELSSVVEGTQEMARMKAAIESMTADADSIIRRPRDTLEAFVSVARDLAESAAAPRDILEALLDVARTDPQPPAVGTSATRERERANQGALQAALRRVALIEAARLLPQVAFETIEGATSLRNAVAELIEEQEATAGDAVYPALVQLRSTVSRAVPGDAALARIRTTERAVPVPSLLLSYQLYGSTRSEADIIARNGVQHPGFIAGQLRVLSDE